MTPNTAALGRPVCVTSADCAERSVRLVAARLTFPIRAAGRSVRATFIAEGGRRIRPSGLFCMNKGPQMVLQAVRKAQEMACWCAEVTGAVLVYLFVKMGPAPPRLFEARRGQAPQLATEYAGVLPHAPARPTSVTHQLNEDGRSTEHGRAKPGDPRP